MTRSQLLAGAVVLGIAAIGTPASAAMSFMNAAGVPGRADALVQVATTPYLSYSPRNVQMLLGQLGYNVGIPDGVIGPKSRAAIRAFQIDAGLPQSGEPSVVLFGKLQEAVAKLEGPPQPAPAPVAQAPSSDLVGGIQGELLQRGYDIPSVSGRVDAQTTAAIRSYQQAAGLTVTGQPSQALLVSLQSAPRSAAAVSKLQREQVVGMQRALNNRGFDAGPEDGAIGPKVRAAIRGYQASNGMRVTGEVSPELLADLGVIAPLPGTVPPPSVGSTPPQPTPDNGFGMTTGQLLQLEQSLTALGYKVGDVDGIYDRKTRKGITDYQQDNQVAEDGLPTPSLMASVQANLAARTGVSTTAVGRAGNLSASQIAALQQSLGRQGYYFGNASGVYDAQTESAVRGYQRDAGLQVNGAADAALLARLQGGPAASPAVVRAIEDELNRRGYRVGPIDGQNDPQTQAAIDDFLRHAQLQLPDTPSEQLLGAIRTSRMTAQEGARRDFLSNLFGSQ